MNTRQRVARGTPAFCVILALAACARPAPRVPGANDMTASQPAAGAPVSHNAVSQTETAVSHDTRVPALWQERRGLAGADFCLGPGDLVEISVPRVPEMQGMRARVSPTGTISLPNVGTIQAAGATEAQLRDRIRGRLGQTLLRDPQVTLFIAENASQQVSVTGAVARPGLYGLSRQNRTVADLLSEAGGMNERAGGTVQFYPGSGGGCGAVARPQPLLVAGATPGAAPIEIDLNREWQPPAENPLNMPAVGGDAIVVNRGQYFVDGWVQKPGAYDLSPGTTALGGLTAAGGATYPADLKQVVVWRTEPGGTKKQMALDVAAIRHGQAKDLTLQSGDVVSVPASTAKMAAYSGYWIVTNMVRIGAGLSF